MTARHLVSEMISSINSAIKARVSTVLLARTNFNVECSKLLYVNGLISNFSIQENGIVLTLKYQNSKSVITSLNVISTPGKRVFWRLSELRKNYNYETFAGFFIISTHKGLCISTDCLLKDHIAGEVILKVAV